MASFLTSKAGNAAPSISGMSGDFDHGAPVTITGSSFGTRGDYNGSSSEIADFLPVVWKNFEDSTLVSDGLTVENNHTQSWVIESTAAKSNSVAHGKRIFYPHGVSVERVAGLQKTQSGTTGNYFFSFWFYLPALSTVTMIDEGKLWRIYGSATAGNILMETADNSSEFQTFSECGSNCSPQPPAEQSKVPGFKLGEWQRIDIAMSQSPDQYIVYKNMQKFFCIASATSTFTNCVWPVRQQYVYNPFGGNGHTFLYGHMIYGPSTGGDGGYYKFDDLFADYSLAHVEVCNQPTWNALLTGGASSMTAHCEVQIPTSWSSNSITIDLNTGSFPSGSNVYAYVITENGTAENFDVNANGFAFQIGESGTGEEEGGEESQPGDGILVGYETP